MDTILSAFPDAATSSHIFVALFSIVVKGAFILALTGLSVHLLRGSAAALRHLVWTCGVVVVLVLPLLVFALPGWSVALIPDSVASFVERHDLSSSNEGAVATAESRQFFAARGTADSLEPAQSLNAEPEALMVGSSSLRSMIGNLASLSWFAWALLVWFIGTAALMVRLVIAHLGVLALLRRADRVDDDDWQLALEDASVQLGLSRHVRLRQSDWLSVPISVGLRRPTVILPAHAFDWNDETRRTVLLHELAHVRRRDCLVQLVVEVTRALYWVNPMVWVAAFQMKIERERACDDAVIVSGTTPSSYARTLLDIARSMTDRELSGAAVMAMARKSELEGRLLSILDSSPKLRTVNRAAAILSMLIVISLALPVSVIEFARATERDDPADEKILGWVDEEEGHEAPDSSTDEVQSPRRYSFSYRYETDSSPEVRERSEAQESSSWRVNRDRDDNTAYEIKVADNSVAKRSARNAWVTSAGRDEEATIDREIQELDARIDEVKALLDLPVFDEDSPAVYESDAEFGVLFDASAIERIIAESVHQASRDIGIKLRGLEIGTAATTEWDDAGPNIDEDLVRMLKKFGFHFTEAAIEKMSRIGIDEDLVLAIGKSGFRFDSDDMISLSVSGVDEDLVRVIGKAGFRFDADEIVQLAQSHVDEELIVELGKLGTRFTAREIAKLASNDVCAEFVAVARQRGYHFSADEFVLLSKNHVGTELLVAASRAGYNFDARELSQIARAGVDPGVFKVLAKAGVRNVSAGELIKMSRSEICVDCLSDIVEVTGDRFGLADLQRLYASGVDADALCKISERGMLTADVDALIQLSRQM